MSTALPTPTAVSIPPDVIVAIVAARWNAGIVGELLTGCRRKFLEAGLDDSRVRVFRVPGAFEMPVAAEVAAAGGKFAAVVCLGCVIRGDTPHFEYVAGEAARGIGQVSIKYGVPVIFGVLTTNTEQQAVDRTGGSHGHVGVQSAEAALEMIATLAAIRSV